MLSHTSNKEDEGNYQKITTVYCKVDSWRTQWEKIACMHAKCVRKIVSLEVHFWAPVVEDAENFWCCRQRTFPTGLWLLGSFVFLRTQNTSFLFKVLLNAVNERPSTFKKTVTEEGALPVHVAKHTPARFVSSYLMFGFELVLCKP